MLCKTNCPCTQVPLGQHSDYKSTDLLFGPVATAGIHFFAFKIEKLYAFVESFARTSIVQLMFHHTSSMHPLQSSLAPHNCSSL